MSERGSIDLDVYTFSDPSEVVTHPASPRTQDGSTEGATRQLDAMNSGDLGIVQGPGGPAANESAKAHTPKCSPAIFSARMANENMHDDASRADGTSVMIDDANRWDRDTSWAEFYENFGSNEANVAVASVDIPQVAGSAKDEPHVTKEVPRPGEAWFRLARHILKLLDSMLLHQAPIPRRAKQGTMGTPVVNIICSS